MEKAVDTEKVSENKVDVSEKVKRNPWVISTIVLAVIALILFVMSFTGFSFGNISSTAAGNAVADFAAQQGFNYNVVSVVSEDGFYKVTLDMNGQDVPVYTTMNGKYLLTQLIPLTVSSSDSGDSSTPTEVPKTDKPKVELYVFTYCPYGLQMEKAMIPVVQALGDSIDFRIRQIGAMHGPHEQTEAERQLCIEQEYPDKFLSYIEQFAINTEIGNCDSDTGCSLPKVNALMTSLGISSAKIDSCMKNAGEALYNAEVSNANSKGVSGSPTLIINGVDAQASRSQAGVAEAVCAAFTDGKAPVACSQEFSTAAASAGFGASTSSGSASSSATC